MVSMGLLVSARLCGDCVGIIINSGRGGCANGAGAVVGVGASCTNGEPKLCVVWAVCVMYVH